MAGIEAPWNRGHGPLHYAATAGKVEMSKFLIKDLKVDVDTTGNAGNILLLSCSSGGAFPCSSLWNKVFFLMLGEKCWELVIVVTGDTSCVRGQMVTSASVQHLPKYLLFFSADDSVCVILQVTVLVNEGFFFFIIV